MSYAPEYYGTTVYAVSPGLSRRAKRKIVLYADEEHSPEIECSDDWTGETKLLFTAESLKDGTTFQWSQTEVTLVPGDRKFMLNSVANLTDGAHGNLWLGSLRLEGQHQVFNVYDILVKYAP